LRVFLALLPGVLTSVSCEFNWGSLKLMFDVLCDAMEIMQTRPEFQNPRQRPVVYAKDFLFSLTESLFQTFFAPSVTSLSRKALQMEKRVRLTKEYDDMITQFHCSPDAVPFQAMCDQFNAQDDEVDRSNLEEQRVRFKLAAQNSDLRAELRDEFGRLIGGIMSLYVCMGGEFEHPCATLIASKAWDRLREDPLQSGQKCWVGFKRWKLDIKIVEDENITRASPPIIFKLRILRGRIIIHLHPYQS
jgi:hypothetical protein